MPDSVCQALFKKNPQEGQIFRAGRGMRQHTDRKNCEAEGFVRLFSEKIPDKRTKILTFLILTSQARCATLPYV